MVGSYGLLILYMQYAKHKWKITQPTDLHAWLTVLHAELALFLIVAVIAVIGTGLRKGFVVLTGYYLLSFFDFVSWFKVDRPFHPADMMRSAEFVWHYPEFIKDIGLKTALLALVPGLIWFACGWLSNPSQSPVVRRMSFCTALCVGGLCLVAWPLAYQRNYFEYNSIVSIAEEYLYESKLKGQTIQPAQIEQLLGLQAPRAGVAPACAERESAAKRANILFFVIETAPKAFYPDFPEFLQTLGDSALAGRFISSREHYTTYPESDRAIYSILTGKYPPLERGSQWVGTTDYSHALPRILTAQGYTTYLISTAPLDFHDNRTLMENLGFHRIIEIESTKKALSVVDGRRVWDRSKLYAADDDLLRAALAIIDQHSQSQAAPFFMVLTPQASHAPFGRPPGFSPQSASDVDLIKANAEWQFHLLKKIINELELSNQLAETVLVVTGDHGLRSRYESEQLFKNPHLLSKLTYSVPFWLMLSGNQSVQDQVIPTSHIDIAPTVLDFVCINYNNGDYHGRNIFNKSERTVFFLGGDYLPVDGYKNGNQYFMENRKRKIIESSSSFEFKSVVNNKNRDFSDVEDTIDSVAKGEISEKIRMMKTLLLQRQ